MTKCNACSGIGLVDDGNGRSVSCDACAPDLECTPFIEPLPELVRASEVADLRARVAELEGQLATMEGERNSWRDKWQTCHDTSESAWRQLGMLRPLLAEMEHALPQREGEIRRQIHQWLYPPFSFIQGNGACP